MELHHLSLNPMAAAKLLCWAVVCLLAASLAGQLSVYGGEVVADSRLVRLFNVDLEENVPAYFSALLLFTASVILFTISILESKGTFSASRFLGNAWLLLAVGFLLLSVDELFSLHERLGEPIGALLGDANSGLLRFAWVLPGSVVVLFLAIVFKDFVFSLMPRPRRLMIASAVIYVGGAIGVEAVTGWHFEVFGKNNLGYNLLVTIEEGLEMVGVVVFIYSLLVFLEEKYANVTFRIASSAPPERSAVVNPPAPQPLR